MIKVALIVSVFPDVYFSYTYPRLTEISQRGISQTIYFSSEGDSQLMASKGIVEMMKSGVKISFLPSERISLISYFKLLFNKNLLKNLWLSFQYFKNSLTQNKIKETINNYLRFAPLLFNDLDLIHFETSYLALGMLRGLQSIGVPIIISLRGADVDEKPQSSKKWLDFYHLINNQPNVYFHCVSNYIKQKAVKLGIIPAKLHVIHLGSTPKGFDTEKIREYENVKGLITVARLSPEKSVETLIRCLRLIHDAGYDLPLYIIGDGPLRQSLGQLATDLGLQNFVIFFGKKENDWVMEYLERNSHNNIYIQPSKFEAFPQSLLDAMSFGFPVIATRVGGIPEIVLDEHTGLLCESQDEVSMFDKLIQLLQSHDLRASLAENARDHVVQNFSRSIEAEKFVDYYKSFLGKKS